MAMMPAYTAYDSVPMELETDESVASSAPWRLRDMAQEILSNRVIESAGSAKQQKARKQPMSLSTHFDVDTCLARIRRDKAAVVRNAFEAAATAVLETLEKKDEEEMETESINEDDLPAMIKDSRKLDELRAASMERSHDNKDVSKRKASMPGKNNLGANGVGDSSGSGRGGAGGSLGGGGAKSGSAVKKTKKASESKAKPGVKEAPKFTRNTPASSAAALDSRLTSSRAILCTAANVAFDTLTPPLPGYEVDVADVPQNPARKNDPSRENNAAISSSSVNNMGAVVIEAQTLGQRVESVAQNAARRSTRRHQYRKDNFRCNKPKTSYLQVKNPFAWKDSDSEGDDDDTDDENIYHPSEEAITEFWSNVCLPRLMAVLQTGAGHALLHDVHWESRHGRVANLLETLTRDKNNCFGPHLIITTEPDVDRFGQEFRSGNSHLRLLTTVHADSLRVLRYTGTPEQRTKLRKQFPEATGLPEAPFHIIITSYANFLQDYLHFCQTPFEAVVVDDGVSWMAAAQGDPNSAVGLLWDSAIWSKSDQQVGLAGALHKDWDYSIEEFDEDTVKEAWIGLSARHRIMTSSILRIQQRNSVEAVPISGLVNFVAPHYADVVREEWDRSRIATDAASMEHFRKLLTRSLVVHYPGSSHQDTYKLAMQALQGELPTSHRSDSDVPELIPDDQFVSEGKVAYSRRAALQWLGPPEESWLRYELGLVNFQPILEAMKLSELFGHMCEEVVTASSTTSSGATGQVTGTLAYRLAVRCGRHFGSEQGLRQHVSALHAPPGTWLCRTCGSDCITSQARTHHERSCGLPSPAAGSGDNVDSTGAPSVGSQGPGKPGRQQHGPSGVVGKKKGPKTAQPGAPATEEKDADGSFRVPGYRGVWINQAGKHFVKINGERLSKDDDVLYFDNIDEAAKKHDAVLKARKFPGKVEYNFKEDGSRVIYEDVTTSSTTGLGGSASSVVPALSVINIKDLPPDVKPLLRDPRQTSRTGGNSKRHVYAYRGVCRQARKGHDRWQSQISFMGVNHYLGTFDSEWDAAAIYAWAHLILYGEEATKQAQKEGEEAAAAYEQEKRDIAAGKIPAPPPKPEKKKRKVTKKKDQKEENADDGAEGGGGKTIKKKKTTKDDVSSEKKAKAPAKIDKESIAPILAKGVGRAPVLAPRVDYKDMSDIELAEKVSTRITAARALGYCVTDLPVPAPVKEEFRPCAPWSLSSSPAGGAMLLGVSSALFGWEPQAVISKGYFESETEANEALSALNDEYGPGGFNESFRTVVQGTNCVIGSASQRTRRVYESLGLGMAPIGCAVGAIDCNIGGTPRSCGEYAACIRYLPTASGDFQFSALSSDDVITMNGQRVTADMGSFPLFNEDVCTVGSRVFVFLLPTDT